jgi:hypothetical protein
MTKRPHLETTLASALDKAGYDAVIGVSPENVQHLCGVFIASQRMIRDRLAFVVFQREGAPFIVVSSVVTYTARTHSWIEDVAPYQEHVVRPIDGLVAALQERGLGKARFLVEMGALPVGIQIVFGQRYRIWSSVTQSNFLIAHAWSRCPRK